MVRDYAYWRALRRENTLAVAWEAYKAFVDLFLDQGKGDTPKITDQTGEKK